MKKNLTKLIIAIAAFSLTIAAVVGYITFTGSSSYLQEEIERNVQTTAEKYANRFSAIFNHTEGTVDSLTAFVAETFNPDRLAEDPGYMETYKETLKGVIAETVSASSISLGLYVTFEPTLTPDDDEVWYSYKDGKVTYTQADFERNQRKFEEPVPANMAYFFEPIKSGEATWTGPYYDRDIQVHVLSYSKAIYAGDFFVGIAGADVTTEDTTDLIRNMHPYEDGFAFLLNEDMEFVIAPEFVNGDRLEDMIPDSHHEISAVIKDSPSGNLRLQINGKEYITGFSRMDNDWILGISQPVELAFTPFYNLNRVMLTLAIIITLLVILFSIFFSIYYSRPIDRRQQSLEQQNREKDILLIYQSRQAKIGEMVGNVAHQWKQPLNNINLVLANIMDAYRYGDIDEESLKKSIDKANSITGNMSKTINDFSGFLKPPKEKELFDVHHSISIALSLMEESLHKENIKVRYQGEDSSMAYGYANEFSHVLFNVIGNARDAIISENPPERQVDIRIYKEEGQLMVHIINHCCHLDESVISRAFEPYFTTKEESGGTGIGLYISKVIMEQRMDGKIGLKNTEEGVCCILSLPGSLPAN